MAQRARISGFRPSKVSSAMTVDGRDFSLSFNELSGLWTATSEALPGFVARHSDRSRLASLLPDKVREFLLQEAEWRMTVPD